MIVSIAFLALAALVVLGGVLKGRKYTWVYSAVKLVCAVVAAVISMLLASVLGGIVGNLLVDTLAGSLGVEIFEIPALNFAVKALVGMLIAPFLFWIVYLIVHGVIKIFIPLFCRLLLKALPSKVTGVGNETVPQVEAEAIVEAEAEAVVEAEAEAAVEEEAVVEAEAVAEEPIEEPKPSKKKRNRKDFLRVHKANPLGMLCGGLCALVVFCIGMTPLIGLVDTACDTASAVIVLAGDENTPDEVLEILDVATNNAGTKLVHFMGGRALYRGMTTYRADGETVRLLNETEFLGALGDAGAAYRNKNVSRGEAADKVRYVATAMKKSTLIPKAGAELFSSAADSWTAGEKYYGIAMPKIGGFGDLFGEIVASQKGATTETFREDMGALISIVARFVETDALSNAKDNTMALFSDRELTEGIIYELLESPRLYVAVGGALNVGVDGIGTSLQMHKTRDALYEDFCDDIRAVARPVGMARALDGLNEEQKRAAKDYQNVLEAYGIKATDQVIRAASMAASQSNVDMVEWFATAGVVTEKTMPQKSVLVTAAEVKIESVKVQNPKEEAAYFAEALCVLSTVTEKAGAADMDVADLVTDFGPAFDWLAKTETVGRDTSAKLFKAILQSQKVSGQIGFSVFEASEIADTINENANRSSYASQMLSLSQTVRVIRNSGTTDAEAAIEQLLADLTPESASTLQAVSTPSVVMNHGVPERSSVPVSTMMSDMFGNLSKAKQNNMSDEQLQRETVAVNKVMTMAMNTGSSNGSTFGQGSVTGTSAKGFVNDIMDSEVVSQTVVEQVYGTGSTPKNDPLVTERTMSATDEAELLDALNDKWASASATERNDANYKQKLVSTAALMNLSVKVTNSGVVKTAS